MENTIERIYVGEKFGDKKLGLFLIRGENVVLIGEIVRACTKGFFNSFHFQDPAKEGSIAGRVTLEEIIAARKSNEDAREGQRRGTQEYLWETD